MSDILRSPFRLLLSLLLVLDASAREPIPAPTKTVRARDLGIPFDGTPGKFNAITDVPGVEVGYTTLISGEGKLEVGKGPVRTGVTAILPRGRDAMNDPVFAGYFSLNGNGEMTGTAWVEESGFLEGPIVLTNTHSVGVARDAVIAWRLAHGGPDAEGFAWSLPVVAETWDGWLNDVDGFHVKPEHVAHAIESAHSGAIEEGSVGGGTGMICYEFKGGTGTASRIVPVAGIGIRGSSETKQFAVGVLVQANCGRRPQLTIRGLEVGKRNSRLRLQTGNWLHHHRGCDRCASSPASTETSGPPCFSRSSPHRQRFRQRLRRSVHRLLHRQPACRRRQTPDSHHRNHAERSDGPAFHRHGRSDRRSHHQRSGR